MGTVQVWGTVAPDFLKLLTGMVLSERNEHKNKPG